MPEPIIFIDLRDRDDAERQRLRDRQFELQHLKDEFKGKLPPIFEEELTKITGLLADAVTKRILEARKAVLEKIQNPSAAEKKELITIIKLLDDEKNDVARREYLLQRWTALEAKGDKRDNDEKMEYEAITKLHSEAVVDPLFNKLKETLERISPHKVEDHVGGKFRSQRGKIERLTDAEETLAAVYGILSQDNQINPELSRFVKAVSIALGEYTDDKNLFQKALGILIKEGDIGPEREVEAAQWVAVVRSLRADGVTADNRHLPLQARRALAGVDGTIDGAQPSTIGIDLPDLEEEADLEIVADNLDAVQAIYFAAMLEELKFFQVVDKLVELFNHGMLPLGRGDAGDRLYRYWKDSDERFTEIERRNLYARALGFPGGDPSQSPNRDFDNLWLRFLSGVSSFTRQLQVDHLLRSDIPVAVSQEQVRKSGRDLAANLSLHGYGIAYFAATELQKQIVEIKEILSNSEIRTTYGARDMFQVIDQVATLELGGAKNSIRYRTMANSGAVIIRWLATRAQRLAGTSLVDIIDVRSLRNPTPPRKGTKATKNPTDSDLVNACESWLAVNGIPDLDVENYSQPSEAPMTTSRPIQIPAAARELLESVGVSAGMSNGAGHYARR